MDTNNKTAITSEQESPIFSLTISFTGSQFIVDTNQLNYLSSAVNDDDPKAQDALLLIQGHLQDTYQKVTPLLEDLLVSIFGESSISKSAIKSVSESTIFFIGGDNEDER